VNKKRAFVLIFNIYMTTKGANLFGFKVFNEIQEEKYYSYTSNYSIPINNWNLKIFLLC